METSPKPTPDSRGAGGRGRGSGRTGGRNPWGRGRGQSAGQAFAVSVGIVKPGSTIVWSKWIRGAKELL